VEAVSAHDILEMANQVFDKQQLSQIVFEGSEE
jgi:hypothetical protein